MEIKRMEDKQNKITTKFIPIAKEDLFSYAQKVSEQLGGQNLAPIEKNESVNSLSDFLHLMSRLVAKRLNTT